MGYIFGGRISGEEATYISRTHNTANLLHRVQVGAQTTVHGEDLLVDDGGNRQAVEAIGECLPKLDVVPSFAFIIETIDLSDLPTFMVTSYQCYLVWVSSFQC